jgi:L-rhamnose isomerase
MRFRKALTFLVLATALVLALPAWAQQKPFTQEQVQDLVREGLGDESGAKLIDQRGIDFAPAEDFIQSLKQVTQACFSRSAALLTDRTQESRNQQDRPALRARQLHQYQLGETS